MMIDNKIVVIFLLINFALGAPQGLPLLNDGLKALANGPDFILDKFRNEFNQVPGTAYQLQNSFRLGNVLNPLITSFDNLAEQTAKNSFGLFAQSVEGLNKLPNLIGGSLMPSGKSSESMDDQIKISIGSPKVENTTTKPEDVRR
ncbi:hypothetical protein FQA39_LY17778 [Lamprigera yunnana]|nr:hypothetical protein FQA39_LY17778 [Lamprigera yunnana]